MSPKIYGFFFSTANLTCIHEEQVSEKRNQENDMHFEGKIINTTIVRRGESSTNYDMTKQWKIPPIYQRLRL